MGEDYRIRDRRRVFSGRRGDQVGRPRDARTFLPAAKKATGGQRDRRDAAVADRGRQPFRTPTSPTARPSCASCARRSARSPRSMVSPSSPPARIRPRYGVQRSRPTGDRYDTVMNDLQMIGQRNMLCGLHVHVELPDPTTASTSCTACCRICRCSSRCRRRRRSGSRAGPASRAIASPPMTSCRAPACRSCSASARNSTPMSRR